MNLTVKDIDVLQAIHSQDVAEYLEKHGWQQQNQILDKASIWKQNNEGDKQFKIILPLNHDIPGFPVSMSVILKTLEKAENRSQVEIIGDLITTAKNLTNQGVVLQIQPPNADKISGTITLLVVVFDKLRKIQTELLKHDYILAIKAYQERLPITCTGDLIKEDSCFVLKNSRDLALDESWKN
jgi:predicted Zn-ribbon and HTH transcriptional regulator